MSNATTVSTLSQQCLDRFREAMKSKNDIELQDRLQNRLASFNLWVDGIGALAKSGASLDSKLQSYSDILNLVKSLLNLLSDLVVEFADISSEGHAITKAFANMDSVIKNLANIGAAIRRGGKASRSRRENESFNPDEHHDFKRHLECLVLLRPDEEQPQSANINGLIDSIPAESSDMNGILKVKLEQLEKSRTEELDPSKLTEIQKRLIDANLRRRHHFLVAQKQSQRLKQTAQSRMPIDEQQSEANASKFTENVPTAQPKTPAPLENEYQRTKSKAPPTVASSSKVASTIAGTLPSNLAEYQQRATTTAYSKISFIAANTEFPKPPSSSRNQPTFKCPCCCQPLPSEDFTSPSRWK